MILSLFEYRLKADVDKDEWEKAQAGLTKVASETPGFIAQDRYASEDDGVLVVTRFESQEALEAYSTNPAHAKAATPGRAFFESYTSIVAESSMVREYEA